MMPCWRAHNLPRTTTTRALSCRTHSFARPASGHPSRLPLLSSPLVPSLNCNYNLQRQRHRSVASRSAAARKSTARWYANKPKPTRGDPQYRAPQDYRLAGYSNTRATQRCRKNRSSIPRTAHSTTSNLKPTFRSELLELRLHRLRQQHLRLDLRHLHVPVRVAVQQQLSSRHGLPIQFVQRADTHENEKCFPTAYLDRTKSDRGEAGAG